MSNVRITLRGDLANRLAREAGLQALHVGAEAILTESIDQTPIKSGTLRRSGTVTDVFSRGEVNISYNTPYAIKQHEDLNLRHTDGKAKYLEDPFNHLKPRVIDIAQRRIRDALRRG